MLASEHQQGRHITALVMCLPQVPFTLAQEIRLVHMEMLFFTIVQWYQSSDSNKENNSNNTLEGACASLRGQQSFLGKAMPELHPKPRKIKRKMNVEGHCE